MKGEEPGAERRSMLTRWAKLLAKILFVLAVFLGIISFIGIEYTATPEFCITCHYMRPYYDAWKTSTHNHVPCVECHYAPGVQSEMRGKFEALSSVAKYVTGTYGTKPWAEISDRSCLRSGCHDKRLLRGKVVFKTVVFDHGPHLAELRRGKRLRCTSCHSQIVQGEHMTVTESACFLCHFKDVEAGEPISGCPSCHGAPTGVVRYRGIEFDHRDATRYGIECEKCHVKVVQGDGAILRERCFLCHAESDRLERYGDPVMLHDAHVTEHKVECTECHQEIQHRTVSMAESIGIECQSCHPDHHAAQKELYMGIGGKGVESVPDPMFLTRVSCKACHIVHKGSKIEGITSTAPAAACMSCHGTKYGRMLDEWKGRVTEILNQLLPVLDRTEKEIGIAARRGLDVREARALLEDAKYNVELVRYGRGVHNIKYSDNLLRAASQKLTEALSAISSSYHLPGLAFSEVAAQSECFHCHYGVENKNTDIFDTEFQHKQHIVENSLPCTTCHSNTKEHGEMILSQADCSKCHHRGVEESCEVCHNAQFGIYSGRTDLASEMSPSVMFEAGIGCLSCHSSDEENVIRPGKERCIQCHDEGYDEVMVEWQESTQELLREAEGILAKLMRRRLIAEDKKLVESSEKVIAAVKNDGSSGVHNPDFVDELLSESVKRLKGAIGFRSR